MLIWYLMLPFAVLGSALMWRRDRGRTLLLFGLVLAIAAVYGTIVGNAGSLLRYRSEDILLLSIPIGIGGVAARDRWAVHRKA